ncbi:hypothetical protein [Microbacterium invictum]|uniref:Uncharacterized protein n=1 Tax=Microbacterium invictum TaxID=515415 RepID=A0AA40VLJ9_9MICO|nr:MULTISPECIES: hypothetical protein [Microbacterium]MBB4138902.1 hypothetical protein [Microbacterium invictum]
MSDVSRQDPAPAATEEQADGPAGSVWGSVALFVGFVVVMSGCITLQILT